MITVNSSLLSEGLIWKVPTKESVIVAQMGYATAIFLRYITSDENKNEMTTESETSEFGTTISKRRETMPKSKKHYEYEQSPVSSALIKKNGHVRRNGLMLNCRVKTTLL